MITLFEKMLRNWNFRPKLSNTWSFKAVRGSLVLIEKLEVLFEKDRKLDSFLTKSASFQHCFLWNKGILGSNLSVLTQIRKNSLVCVLLFELRTVVSIQTSFNRKVQWKKCRLNFGRCPDFWRKNMSGFLASDCT